MVKLIALVLICERMKFGQYPLPPNKLSVYLNRVQIWGNLAWNSTTCWKVVHKHWAGKQTKRLPHVTGQPHPFSMISYGNLNL